MQSIKQVLGYAILEISVIIIEFFLYYSRGQTIAPLIVGGVLALVVLAITATALYESIKHRDDKEPW